MKKASAAKAPDHENSVVKSVGRVFEVLEAFNDVRRPMAAIEIAKRLDYPPSSTAALLKSMVRLGYLSFERTDRSYFPTIRIAIISEYLHGALFGQGRLMALMGDLHSQIGEYLAQGIEVKYLLYPRNGPASDSWVKAEQVWCADDRNEALTLAKLDKAFETHSCDSSAVSRQYAIGQDVGLRGTPAIVLEDGSLISGYLPAAQLAEALAATSAR